MNKLTSFQYFYNSKAATLDVILHGGSRGIESSFIKKIFESSKNSGNSVIAFNFPYLERGEEGYSGPELKEELEILQKILDYCNYKERLKVRLVGKSLGGIIASYYLDQLSEHEASKFSIVILGYIRGDVKLKNFKGPIAIIQGEKDKFGGIEVVKEDMKDAKSLNIEYIEVANADHSYRVPETKKPIYEDKAIGIFSSLR